MQFLKFVLTVFNCTFNELAAPGRDPRQSFFFDETIHKITDFTLGMSVPGIVTNITSFGAFVNIGIHQNGLVHISQLAGRYVKDPNEIVSVRQQVQVKGYESPEQTRQELSAVDIITCQIIKKRVVEYGEWLLTGNGSSTFQKDCGFIQLLEKRGQHRQILTRGISLGLIQK